MQQYVIRNLQSDIFVKMTCSCNEKILNDISFFVLFRTEMHKVGSQSQLFLTLTIYFIFP